jgi:sugar porter (SP) family MFS transporter
LTSESTLITAPVKGGASYVYLVALVAAAGGFIWGYDIVIMSSAILFLEDYFHLSSSAKGFAMTSATIGILGGVILGGRVTDWIGRKTTLIVAAILFTISAMGTAFPVGFMDWNLYRIMGGVAAGLAMLVSPMYIAEVSPANRRGLLVTMNQLAIVLGAFLSAVAAHYIAVKTGESVETAWRWMLASAVVPIVPFIIGLLFIPESPRWLIQKNRLAEAKAILVRIDGPAHADQEMSEIESGLHEETGSFAELFQKGIRFALLIAVMLAAFQQLCGQSCMTFYAPNLFVEAGEKTKTGAIMDTVILRTWNTAWTIFALLTVDRFGRRPLLMWGISGMGIAQLIYGVVFQLNLSAKYLLIAMFLGEATYMISLAPIAWLVMSEIFPNRIRARGMMVAALVLQVTGGAVNWLFPVLKEFFSTRYGLPGGLFWIFSLICLSALLFVYKFVPETKGKSLEEIADSWLH